MPEGQDPQAGIERRAGARHLLGRPLTCAETDPEIFRLIRRHETELDRWFTQRLGYRLHVDADTARLFKSGTVPAERPLRTASERPFTQLEYVVLALALAATAAGPAVVSLRDLVEGIRLAGAEAEISLTGDATERRAIVVVLRWMIDHGLAEEMHESVDVYASDEEADAVLRIRPERISLVPLPALVGANDSGDLLHRAERRDATRQWLRGRLVEDTVVYRQDVTDAEWAELRRRLSEEERILYEMFGFAIEARAEGVAAIDPEGALSDRRFPTTGTVGHAALLLIERLAADRPGEWIDAAEVERHVEDLIVSHPRWANNYVVSPSLLTRHVLQILGEMRLADLDGSRIRLLAAAARFLAVEESVGEESQAALW